MKWKLRNLFKDQSAIESKKKVSCTRGIYLGIILYKGNPLQVFNSPYVKRSDNTKIHVYLNPNSHYLEITYDYLTLLSVLTIKIINLLHLRQDCSTHLRNLSKHWTLLPNALFKPKKRTGCGHHFLADNLSVSLRFILQGISNSGRSLIEQPFSEEPKS